MRKFSDPLRDQLTSRTFELVVLLDITLPDGATAYVSTRRIDVAIQGVPRTYVRRITSWSGVSQNITGSSSTASFTLSNVDRALSTASRDHGMNRGICTFRLFNPRLHGAGGQTFETASFELWSGYITDVHYDLDSFTITARDGFYSLSLPLPRVRFTRTCANTFDDGVYCPYSMYGRQQRRNPDGTINAGEYVWINDSFGNPINTVTGFTGETFVSGGNGWQNGSSDFGPEISQAGPTEGLEGHHARPGYVSCPKTFTACFQRGMPRFFRGLRYVTSWATGHSGGSSIVKILSFGFGGGGDNYTSFSFTNDSIYNKPVPLIYGNLPELPLSPLTGVFPPGAYIMTPMVFQSRPEQEYEAVEAIVSLGRMGKAADNSGYVAQVTPPASRRGEDVEAIREVFVNGLPPHEGQYPKPPFRGVFRSTGRIGEPAQSPQFSDSNGTKLVTSLVKICGKTGPAAQFISWDGIGGDMSNADCWINPITGAREKPPIIWLSNMAGFSARVQDKNAGINNPQSTSDSGTPDSSDSTGQDVPDVRCRLQTGRYVWHPTSLTTRTYGPTSNPAFVVFDMYLEVTGKKYNTLAEHGTLTDIQSIIDLAAYSQDDVPNIVNAAYTSRRYLFSGGPQDLKPAVDQLDSALKDMYAFRYWRGRKLVLKPFCAGNFESDHDARPAFQEFVNILDASFDSKIPQPKFNSLQLSYADIDFDFTKNTATVYSEDHQKFLSGDSDRMELSRSENLLGTQTTDISVRLGARMLKDEIGGSTRQQWARLREYTFKSSPMMLELETGDITYVAHTLVPAGGQWIRITAWTFNSDFSVTFTARTFEISNYDDTVIGLSSVELAKFAYNPFIPGSGGIAYLPLPPLLWADEVVPKLDAAVRAIPLIGIHLAWLPYNLNPSISQTDAETFNRLTLAVQVYRTSAVMFNKAVTATDTTFYCRYTLHLPLAPFPMRIDDPSDPAKLSYELVYVTAINNTSRTITVQRSYLGTTARTYPKGHYAYERLYKGGFLGRRVTSTATEWIVDTESADFALGQKYYCGKEVVRVDNIVQTVENGATITRITVARAQRVDDADNFEPFTEAGPHPAIAQIMHVSFLDSTPDFSINQFGTRDVYEYIDPWTDVAPTAELSSGNTPVQGPVYDSAIYDVDTYYI